MSIDDLQMLASAEGRPSLRHLSFVGRSAELDELERLAARGECISLFGPPGVGKSRLLAEFVHQRRAHDQQWVVCQVSRVRSLSELAGVLSAQLQLEAHYDRPAEAEFARLGVICAERNLDGVVFDAFDHLIEQTDFLSQWQQALPELSILVSSRARLPVARACAFRLDPLEVAEAVELFEARARRSRQGFRVDDGCREAVTEIVRRLDCLPVAVELAAARVHVLDPHSLLERLSERFDLLRASPGAMPAEALEDTIAWSWELLDEPSRRCLGYCTIFAADFALEAAEAVIEPDGDLSANVLNLLDDLSAASWMQIVETRTRTRQLRFTMLESLREFSRRHMPLDESRRRAAKARFLAYYVDLAEDLASRIERATGAGALDVMGVERDNILQAVDLGLQLDPPAACRALWALRHFFLMRAAPESLAPIERAAELADQHDDAPHLARMLCLLGELAFIRGRFRLASDSLSQAYATASKLDDRRLRVVIAWASSIPLARMDADAAAERLDVADELLEGMNEPLLEARVRERQGYVHLQMFHLTEAERFFQRARDCSARAGTNLFSAEIVSGLAYVAHRRGNHEGAVLAFEEAVELQQEYGGPDREAAAQFNLAVALHEIGHLERGREVVDRVTANWRDLGRIDLLPLANTLAGAMAFECDETERANALLREAIAHARRVGDAHNQALAEGWWAITRTSSDLSQGPIGLLEDCAGAIDPVRSLDAAAAFLVALVALYAARGDRAQADRARQRLAAMASWLSGEDTYLREVIDTMDAIAGVFLQDVPTARRQAPALLSQLLGDFGEQATHAIDCWPNPFVREFLRRLNIVAEAAPIAHEGSETHRSFEFTLKIHHRGHWFQVDDTEPVDLLTRQAMRRIMGCLADHHRQAPYKGVSVKTLVQHGWPDEVLIAEAGKMRVYSAIRMLRDMGLRGLLVTDDVGYHFASKANIRTVEHALSS